MRKKNIKSWDAYVNFDKSEAYKKMIAFSEKVANLMEEYIELEREIDEFGLICFLEAYRDEYGYAKFPPDFIYRPAIQVLFDVWIHGKTLWEWSKIKKHLTKKQMVDIINRNQNFFKWSSYKSSLVGLLFF